MTKLIMILMITLITSIQANASTVIKDSEVFKAMETLNNNTDTYELDFSEVCDLEFSGTINQKGQCEVSK